MNASAHSANDNAGSGIEFLGQLPSILWQRRWIVGATTALGLVASVVTAFILTESYRASALLIVQSSQLPSEVTGEGQSEVVDRRLARIRQQITSRPDLVSLIEKYGLYRDRRLRTSLTEIIEDMRGSIQLTPTTADLPGNLQSQRTVAVRLSFDYVDPNKAQVVAQDLMLKLLMLDSSGNAQQASNKVQFLADQATALEGQINGIESQIAQISASNGGILSNSGITMLGNNSGSYDVQIAALQRDTASLIAQRDAAKSSDSRDPVVANAEAHLAAVRAVYSENHPDVQIALQRLEEAKQLARSNTRKLPLDTIDQQIAFNNSQIAALRTAKSQEVAQISANLVAQSRAPAVQQQISELQQRLTGLTSQYQGVSNRLMEARANARAEDEQMGERLSVAEPPVVPDKPASPNRPKIIGLGLAGGVMLGVAFALLLEMILRPIRTPSGLAAVTGVAPLGIIPVIRPYQEKRSRWTFPKFRRNRPDRTTAAVD